MALLPTAASRNSAAEGLRQRRGERFSTGLVRRWVFLPLILLVLLFQYWLWFGKGGILNRIKLQRQVDHQQQENEALRQRNLELEAQVRYLRQGSAGIEERAREDLGLIKEGETFYLFIDKQTADRGASAGETQRKNSQREQQDSD